MPEDEESLREYVLRLHPELKGADERILDEVKRIHIVLGDVPPHLKGIGRLSEWDRELEASKDKEEPSNDEPGTIGT